MGWVLGEADNVAVAFAFNHHEWFVGELFACFFPEISPGEQIVRPFKPNHIDPLVEGEGGVNIAAAQKRMDGRFRPRREPMVRVNRGAGEYAGRLRRALRTRA